MTVEFHCCQTALLQLPHTLPVRMNWAAISSQLVQLIRAGTHNQMRTSEQGQMTPIERTIVMHNRNNIFKINNKNKIMMGLENVTCRMLA